VLVLGVESQAAEPVFVAFIGHDQQGLIHSPYFRKHFVTACSKDWLFKMKGNSA
jgi:hypothetical protein